MFGCDSDEVEVKNFLEYTVDGETVIFSEAQFVANENCGTIFINGSNTLDTGPQFRFGINLTVNGPIKKLTLADYDDNSRSYKTADYISSETLTISDFSFSQLDRSLSFNFEGTLYEIKKSATKQISGKVRVENLLYEPCSIDPWEIEAEINEDLFTAVAIMGSWGSDLSEWFALSDDGLMIIIVTEKELKDMPVGTYSFTKNDLLNRVMILNYSGPPAATNSIFPTPEHWEFYDYEGELIIEEQLNTPGPKTIGRFSVRASKDKEIVYDVTNGRFGIAK
jgi:hypothetical protein